MLHPGQSDVLGWPENMTLLAGKPFNLQNTSNQRNSF